jgi:hypothetical protein
MRRTSTWWLVLSVVTAIGCDESGEARGPSLPVVDRGPSPSASTDPVGAALHRQVVGHALDFEEVGTTVTGELEAGRVHTHPMVLIGTWCYRVFAQGGSGMEDLALEVVDPNGVPMQRDSEIGPSASLGLVDAICPYAAGRYTLKVRAAGGSGAYAYRVFRKQAL